VFVSHTRISRDPNRFSLCIPRSSDRKILVRYVGRRFILIERRQIVDAAVIQLSHGSSHQALMSRTSTIKPLRIQLPRLQSSLEHDICGRARSRTSSVNFWAWPAAEVCSTEIQTSKISSTSLSWGP